MNSKYLESIETCAAHYGEDAPDVRNYMLEGEKRAYELDNRGPIRFDDNGSLHRNILEAYSKYGFYIFEGVIGAAEMSDIHEDIADLRSRFPIHSGSKVDEHGRPAIGSDCLGPGLLWSKPLSDPLGGTEIANGRHQVKLKDLDAGADAPSEAPFILMGSLQFSEAALRVYGHPALLKAAASINGEDFAPFNEVLFIKDAGMGAAVSWHQDGDSHWDSPEFDEDIHGFNFMAQVYGSTPVNGVWVVPGTHKLGKIDIEEMVKASGSERLTSAVPIVCNPGDVVMCNRQLVHGSFANAGLEPRLTINFGFHKRSSVLDVEGAGIHSQISVYTDDIIKERSKVIGYAISARQSKYPDEQPYDYKPFTENDETYVWDAAAKSSLKDYNLLDLSI
ncbi:phytanoyl-CoA dioxygenase family protein [Kordiimonas sp. SCSIO 12610]|uniref:phytanoyl-CoA dioxygenase family protein n=1 Tax=Kordiimonas sp. SCSIO 12610 TaxID=2829597 RepID=UPI002108B674|nr:phytanoyl-CoA dioxygenase family protein [Kordiimonas sp. SCSIO 12610]UTW56298.1 phytanoyl-CoA dioxygenase family protein [Kordiimonas sp. SCSIO 12610]